MPERCHRENSEALHPLGNKGGIDNRAEFNQWKRAKYNFSFNVSTEKKTIKALCSAVFWYDQALKELSRRGIK